MELFAQEAVHMAAHAAAFKNLSYEPVCDFECMLAVLLAAMHGPV